MYGFIGITVSVAVLSLSIFLPAWAANPYDLGRLEYFIVNSKKNKPKKQAMNWQKKDELPESLVQLLEEPTPMHAKAYVEWTKARDEQIEKVQALIDKETRAKN